MPYIIFLTLLFSITTAASVFLIGNRNLIGGPVDFYGIVKVILNWRFILGAMFAFCSRILFLMINSALYKIPGLSKASTTITAFITSVSLIFVILANYLFLGEKINITQAVGIFVILFGIFLITR